MKKQTQIETNPFPYSDTNKRYHTYDYYLRHQFGEKIAKIPLDAGMTGPTLDGKKGHGGCSFCAAGATDRAIDPTLPIEEQYRLRLQSLREKWKVTHTIPYLQAHTNTYAPTAELEKLYLRALSLPGAVGLAIATRGDCLSPATARLLSKMGERKPVTVELGLETACDATAASLNRCESFAEFCRGYRLLRNAGNLRICIHLILGLPGENRETVLNTIHRVSELQPDAVKFHLLYILRGTRLASEWESGKYTPLSKDEYISLLCDCICALPPETVVERITGDAPRSELLAPLWSLRKREVLASLDRRLFTYGLFQGKTYGK